MLSGTIGALLRSTMSYFSVAATVPTLGERHAVTSCSAHDTVAKVRRRERAHTLPHTHAHAHNAIDTHTGWHTGSASSTPRRLAFTHPLYPWPTPSPSQVGTVAQLDAATESLPTTVPAAHAVIGAAKNKDVTSITEPVTVQMAMLSCYSYTVLACLMS